MSKPLICIVTPALAEANNGNWQTAHRWQRMLAKHYEVKLFKHWSKPCTPNPAAMLALHAHKSAESIRNWAQAYPGRPLTVVLTGTDLYRDIASQTQAQESLELAHRLVVLQDAGPWALAEPLRSKCRVVFQSCTSRKTLTKTQRHLRVVMVGHLRDEKWPQTLFEAARLIRPDEGIYIDHIGQALQPELKTEAEETAQACPHYRWLQSLPHSVTRNHIQRAHVLVHTSRMEGGAHVVMEAVRSGTPVLASHIDGNVGMLGSHYSGYFEAGNATALVRSLRECRATQSKADGLLSQLEQECMARADLFAPSREQAALLSLLEELKLSPQHSTTPP
jgi:putative glycosyltransferase (TIGR04348 family)